MRATQVMKLMAAAVAVVLVLGGGVYGWASLVAEGKLTGHVETHRAEFPIPFPLTDTELAEAGIDSDADGALALEQARSRGEHLVAAIYGCRECHGRDLSGGVMVDAGMLARIFGPNLTTGPGSRTASFAASDWDRSVRHGVRPDGSPATMPADDFQLMSDRELSDIVTYILSLPPQEGTRRPPEFGPLGKVLIATGKLPLSSAVIMTHDAPHLALPPEATVSLEFGAHLAGVCMGCHGTRLAGGAIAGGDPSWPPAANLTPSPEGLSGWTLTDFRAALTGGVRPDGTQLKSPMSDIAAGMAASMTDVEIEALWLYLSGLAPLPTG